MAADYKLCEDKQTAEKDINKSTIIDTSADSLLLPAFAGCDKCIVFAANNAFVPCMAVMIHSIIEQSAPEHFYDIIILHQNINEFNQSVLPELALDHPNISIRFFNVGQYINGKKFYVENRNNFTIEAYFRLMIPWILSDDYSTALYMDGDMIVLHDLYKIFEYTPNGSTMISAIRDYWGICNCYIPGDGRREYRESIGLDDIDGYVISATVLFNLQQFRNKYSISQIISLAISKKWVQHDQDILNILCHGHIRYISPTWGMMTDYGYNHYLPYYLQEELSAAEGDINVVHFGGRRKPWEWAYVEHDLDFWRYAGHTPFYSILLKKIRSSEYRNYVAEHISADDIEYIYTSDGIERFCHSVSLGKLQSGHTRYRRIAIIDSVLYLDGMVGFFGVDIGSNITIQLEINGERYPADSQQRDDGFIKSKGITTYRGEAFSFSLRLEENVTAYDIKIICMLNDLLVEKTNLGFEKFSPLGREMQNAYYVSCGWAVTTDKRRLHIARCTAADEKSLEARFLKELLNKGYKKAYVARRLAHAARKCMKKPIWLVTDRLNKADENGEAFFRYLNAEKKSEISSYFVIDKNCSDFARLKQYGHVVPAYSFRHKMLHLLADCSISSQTDEVWRNPFGRWRYAYRDMLSKTKFVFLQHGIISNDLSDWLKRKDQYLDGFVVTAPKEYYSVLHGRYGYTDKELWMTGLPRFDLLEDKEEKFITVLPTWRKYLTAGQNHVTGFWNLKPHFEDSVYASFYRNLMHDSRLREKASELGYKLQFKVHPSFLGHEGEFGFDSDVSIFGADVSYREIYSRSSLIVTDYSSAIYDFIYMHKPVMYCQFDAEEFFSGKHTYEKGSFDYEHDGFGEVEYDLDSTVDRIIEYIENGCKLKDKYRERIDKFFAYNDRNNCQRVYDKIMELESR